MHACLYFIVDVTQYCRAKLLKVVIAYFASEQLLPFGFAEKNTWVLVLLKTITLVRLMIQ